MDDSYFLVRNLTVLVERTTAPGSFIFIMKLIMIDINKMTVYISKYKQCSYIVFNNVHIRRDIHHIRRGIHHIPRSRRDDLHDIHRDIHRDIHHIHHSLHGVLHGNLRESNHNDVHDLRSDPRSRRSSDDSWARSPDLPSDQRPWLERMSALSVP